MDNLNLQPIPYLFFDGRCTEALDFYADVLGGKVVSKMHYGDMPCDGPDAMTIPEEAKTRVMNAILELPGGSSLYASDSFPGRESPVSGFMIALNYPTVEQGEAVFNRLAEGGTVSMPFSPTFWAEKFGMLTDKFGIEWAINGNFPGPQ
ncbi:MAG: VOC family protein [Armatimonadetes bacterium]|nr:VOC family protein [Armatimonadota bacterium]